MSRLSNLARSVARIAFIAVLSVAVIAGLFLAWWIAVCAILGYFAYLGVRRLFGATPQRPAGNTTVIEGEYKVVDEPAQRLDVHAPGVRARSDA
jgi:hypothetical protein